MEQKTTISLLRMSAVEAKTGLSESEIRRRVKAGTFPAPIKLSPRVVCFSGAAVDAWIGNVIQGASA